jgi:hypothetical protein
MESRLSLREVRKYLLKYKLTQIDQEILRLKEARIKQDKIQMSKKFKHKFEKFYKGLEIIKSMDEKSIDN